MEIKSEKLAEYYLRLNGFTLTTNFYLHPDRKGGERAEIDLIGVRFPFRMELSPNADDELFTQIKDKSLIVIAEAKRGMCDLNSPWKGPARHVAIYTLS